MWVRLDDTELIVRYRSEFLAKEPDGMVELLTALARGPLADRVWAVTTLNALRLTTAPSYLEEEEHPTVWVGKNGEEFEVSGAAPGARHMSRLVRCDIRTLTKTVEDFMENWLFSNRSRDT